MFSSWKQEEEDSPLQIFETLISDNILHKNNQLEFFLKKKKMFTLLV